MTETAAFEAWAIVELFGHLEHIRKELREIEGASQG